MALPDLPEDSPAQNDDNNESDRPTGQLERLFELAQQVDGDNPTAGAVESLTRLHFDLERTRLEAETQARMADLEFERQRYEFSVRQEAERLELELRREEERRRFRLELTKADRVGGWPSSDQLAEYQRFHPDLVDRLIVMLEKEQIHRHDVERTEVRGPLELARRGQMLAISAVVLVLAFCAVLAFLGAPQVAAIVAGLDLVSLVVVFITGQRSSSQTVEQQPIEDVNSLEPAPSSEPQPDHAEASRPIEYDSERSSHGG